MVGEEGKGELHKVFMSRFHTKSLGGKGGGGVKCKC